MCPSGYVADNGAALSPGQRGCTGRLVEHVRSLGVEPITSNPYHYHPTTQGKNERFGQMLFRYLDQQPLAASTAEWTAGCFSDSACFVFQAAFFRPRNSRSASSGVRYPRAE